jgi:hypothetical protein
MTARLRFALANLALALAGCAGGTSGAAAVEGTVRYDGSVQGPLRVAVFATFPPRGAPVAEVTIDDPRYPQAYAVTGVPPGRVFVLAIVDADPDDGDGYRSDVDAGGAFGGVDGPLAVTVESGRARGVDLTLVDPQARSPWSYGR